MTRYQEQDRDNNLKPAFNVVLPFQGTLLIQLNEPMCNMLIDFFENTMQNTRIPRELVALTQALYDPIKSTKLRLTKKRKRFDEMNYDDDPENDQDDYEDEPDPRTNTQL